MAEWVVAVLVVVGAAFLLVATIGVLRMPDVFNRLQAAAKAATLGLVCIAAAAAAHFREPEVASLAGAVIVFTFLTAPVAAHMVSRAAYLAGGPLWKGTVCDDLRGHYDRAAGRDADDAT
jgi:multicomponent Na+:H+ antiporter subunit G